MKSKGYYTIAVLPVRYFTGWRGLTQGFTKVDRSAVRFWRAPVYHNGERVAAAALREVRTVQRRPIFLWVHIYDTHGPHKQPPKTKKFGSKERDRYDAEVLYVDRVLKQLITGLKKELGKKTLFIITADHGESFDFRHKRRHHAYDLYTPVIHVPLFFCGSLIPPGRRDQLVSLLDVFPTIVNLLKGKAPVHWRGISLVPYLFDPDKKSKRYIFEMMYLPEKAVKHQNALWWIGITTNRYHLVRDMRHNVVQVFEWRKDLHNKNDLFIGTNPQYRLMIKRISMLLYTILPQKTLYIKSRMKKSKTGRKEGIKY